MAETKLQRELDGQKWTLLLKYFSEKEGDDLKKSWEFIIVIFN
jgi:hypothetical protein